MAGKKKGTVFEGDLKRDENIAAEKAEFLDEPEEHEESPEELTAEMSAGDKTANVYTEEGREELREEDELADWEEGFSEGAAETEKAHCAHCGEVLGQSRDIVERRIDEHVHAFCSNDCAAKGVRHAKKK